MKIRLRCRNFQLDKVVCLPWNDFWRWTMVTICMLWTESILVTSSHLKHFAFVACKVGRYFLSQLSDMLLTSRILDIKRRNECSFQNKYFVDHYQVLQCFASWVKKTASHKAFVILPRNSATCLASSTNNGWYEADFHYIDFTSLHNAFKVWWNM